MNRGNADVPPLVSIGVPVFNGAATLESCLDSLLGQTYFNLEIIISDNGSSDETQEICKKYSSSDGRILVFRQERNVGAINNFEFVLRKASGKYFMWAASDDVRTSDFVEENVRFLEESPEFVASTSPNCFSGEELDLTRRIDFDLSGSVLERFGAFFSNAWKSHGIFYSLFRTDVGKNYEFRGEEYVAVDWVFDLFLLCRGEIHRTEKSLTVFGVDGESCRDVGLRIFWSRPTEFFFPLDRFSRHAWAIGSDWRVRDRIFLAFKIVRLNLDCFIRQFSYLCYRFYFLYVRKYIKAA